MAKKPASFTIFVIALSVLIATAIISFFSVDMLFAMLLAVILFIAMIFTLIGFFLGLKFKSDDGKSKSFNKIGLIGNPVVFIIIVILLFLALF